MEAGLPSWPNLSESLLIPPVLSLLSQSQKVCLKNCSGISNLGFCTKNEGVQFVGLSAAGEGKGMNK